MNERQRKRFDERFGMEIPPTSDPMLQQVRANQQISINAYSAACQDEAGASQGLRLANLNGIALRKLPKPEFSAGHPLQLWR